MYVEKWHLSIYKGSNFKEHVCIVLICMCVCTYVCGVFEGGLVGSACPYNTCCMQYSSGHKKVYVYYDAVAIARSLQ